MSIVITWMLVLAHLKTDGAITSQFGPFITVEECQKAGTKWVTEQVGNVYTLSAVYECRPIPTKVAKQ